MRIRAFHIPGVSTVLFLAACGILLLGIGEVPLILKTTQPYFDAISTSQFGEPWLVSVASNETTNATSPPTNVGIDETTSTLAPSSVGAEISPKFFTENITLDSKRSEELPARPITNSANTSVQSTQPPSWPDINSSEPRCLKRNNRTYCCASSWEHELDDWWQQHPSYEVSHENETTFCFSPIRDRARREFYNNTLYPLQWQTDCSNTSGRQLVSSGFAANIGLFARMFLSSLNQSQTFVVAKKNDLYQWPYSEYDNKTKVCESADMECYFLPVSNCKAKAGQADKVTGSYPFQSYKPNTWVREYMLRPKQAMRRKVFEILQRTRTPILPCAAMHVRRTDAVLENWINKRNYFELSDYVEKLAGPRRRQKADRFKSIVLLTDDQSAIDETKEFHSNLNWIYINRTRHFGIAGGYNGHKPSGDPTLEIAIILAEMKLSKHCDRMIYTKSGYKDLIIQAMQIEQYKTLKDLTKIQIDLQRQPDRAKDNAQSSETFFAQLDKKRSIPNFVGKAKSVNNQNSSKTQFVAPLRTGRAQQGQVKHFVMEKQSSENNSTAPRCFHENNQTYCCASSWKHDLDDWWQHHPDYEVSLENATTFCFSPIRDVKRRAFLKDVLYPQQWETNCSNTAGRQLVNSGFAANIGLMSRMFLSALNHSSTFVIAKKNALYQWPYSQYDDKTKVCESADMQCYFLPVSNCHAEPGQADKATGRYPFDIYDPNIWVREYMMRPNQFMRRKAFELLQRTPEPLMPCAVMHVRRTDAVLENYINKRNYFELSDYVKRLSGPKRTQQPSYFRSVVLLTDDQSVIEEAHEFHGQLPWIYINRTRHRGTEGGYNGHIPSGDPIHEIAVIIAEMKLARRCDRLIFTKSGYKDLLIQSMQLEQFDWRTRFKRWQIDYNRQPDKKLKNAQSAEDFFAKLDEKRFQKGVQTARQGLQNAIDAKMQNNTSA